MQGEDLKDEGLVREDITLAKLAEIIDFAGRRQLAASWQQCYVQTMALLLFVGRDPETRKRLDVELATKHWETLMEVAMDIYPPPKPPEVPEWLRPTDDTE